ncbi:MAG: Elongation factor P--(R)-beta-lysine ligase [Chlamydiia bacterium]|nr:Elongation factor P--(R)-beta-lysine ligase [Chlamydiia bacterium]
MLRSVRSFFDKRDVLEVDTPILSKHAPIDSSIDILETMATDQTKGYFHSSPEYAMKKLLAMGAPDIYQLSHVFRKSEQSKKHTIEFTMLEWYRIGFSLEELMSETKELIALFIGDVPCRITDYCSIFKERFNLDPEEDSLQTLQEVSKDFGLFGKDYDRQTYLDFLFDIAEKTFSTDSLVFVTDFPKEQAYLAKTHIKNGKELAMRFEAFYKGYELANGFDELQDSKVQRKRFKASLEKREKMDKPSLPIDEDFLDALDHLPDCSGVAVGFDRLMMLKTQSHDIKNVTYEGM